MDLITTDIEGRSRPLDGNGDSLPQVGKQRRGSPARRLHFGINQRIQCGLF